MLDLKKQPSNILVIGFDLDNTLYPSTPEMQDRIRTRIAEKIASQLTMPVETARVLFDQNYEGNFAWSHSGSRTIEQIGRVYGVAIAGSELVQQSLEEADILDFIQPNPKLKEMLQRLSIRFGLDLITGSKRNLANEKLLKIGIPRELFQHCFCGGEYGSKSDGEVYQHWLRLRQIKPGQALYVGDNKKQDLEVPKRRGIRTCFLGEENIGADYCIRDILDLERVLEGK